MKDILSPSNRNVLSGIASSNVMLAFDYDGTLAPIVNRPERAVMRETTRRLLSSLIQLYPCIVISGRTQRDAMRRLHGIRVHQIIGNHGIEPWRATRRLSDQVAKWLPSLEKVAELPGVWVENKVFSVAIHYRQARQKERARRAILSATRALGDVRVIPGKQVLNVLPDGATHKGYALERARQRLGCGTALYIGDDATDEDVFSFDSAGQLLGIRVGRLPGSKAEYFVSSQTKVDELLECLVNLRRQSGIAMPPWGAR